MKENTLRSRTMIISLLIGTLFAACTPPPHDAAAVVRDSAGIIIVTNAHPSWAPDSGWTIEPAPSVVFGREKVDSGTGLLFPIGAVRLEDGRVVVGDRGSSNLKVFSADGTFERTIGREGDGPGEFKYLARLKACNADSVFADDIAHRFFSVIAPDGSVARTFVLETAEAGRPAFEYACNRRGDILASGWGATETTREEPYRPEVPVTIAGADGKVRVFLGTFPGTEMTPEFRGATPRRMGRWLRLAMSRNVAWIAPGEDSRLLAFTREGALRLIVRTIGVDHPVTKADLDWHRKLSLDSARAEGRLSRVSKQLDAMIPPKTLPAVVALLADTGDYLWVLRYPIAGQAQGGWDIYQPDGVLLGTIVMPPGLFPVEIGHDYVLGIATGDDGSRWIQLHRLHRSDTGT